LGRYQRTALRRGGSGGFTSAVLGSLSVIKSIVFHRGVGVNRFLGESSRARAGLSLKETDKKLAPVARQQVKTATGRGRSGAIPGSRKESGSLGLRITRERFPSGIPEGRCERFHRLLWDPGDVTPGFFRSFVVPGFGAALSGPVRAILIDRVPAPTTSVRAYRSHLAFRRPREAGGTGGIPGGWPPGSCGCHRRRPSREGGPTAGGDPAEAPHGPEGEPPAFPVLFF